MRRYQFSLDNEDSLICANCHLHGESYILAVDTAASNTIIDLAAMIISGYEIKDSIRTTEFETAKGKIEVYVFKVNFISALGIVHNDMEIYSYDFFSNYVFSDFHGVLGLDFFMGYKFCIDLNKFEITIQ